jgi:hypothetical protein
MSAEGAQTKEPDIKNLRTYASAAMRMVTHGQDIPLEQARAMLNTPEGAIYVNTILSQYDMEVVRDAKRLRNYVTNKLILESENPDARVRMRSLELLGKISDVGLFTDRAEVTVHHRSTVDLENNLREKLRRLREGDIMDATIIAPPIAIDENVAVQNALADF